MLCELGSTIAALVAAELALRGHLSPGGGFAVGVAGGTAIGLQLISGGAERSERLFVRYRADLLEKAAVIGFLLVALKVTLGSWSMVQRLVRHCGLL